uniref:Col_cuticle_N domain-containing protein n=1 Tax=Steinernema glaseri TaxID=37863 RepID=A0A1I7YG85_9BILA
MNATEHDTWSEKAMSSLIICSMMLPIFMIGFLVMSYVEYRMRTDNRISDLEFQVLGLYRIFQLPLSSRPRPEEFEEETVDPPNA